MTIYFGGIKLNTRGFDPTLDDLYDLKCDLQARSERRWGEVEEALKKSQGLLSLKPARYPEPGIDRIESEVRKHIRSCPLAGVFVGRYRVSPPPKGPDGDKVLAYTCSDYISREMFKSQGLRRHGLRLQSCVEGESLLADLVRLRQQLENLKNLRNDGLHGDDNWTNQPIGECLNRFSEFDLLSNMAFSVYHRCLAIAMGNHLGNSIKPDFERDIYAPDEVRVYAKKRSESFDFARELEQRRENDQAWTFELIAKKDEHGNP